MAGLVVMVELVLVRMVVAQPEDWPLAETVVASSAHPVPEEVVVVQDCLVVVVGQVQMPIVVGLVVVVGPALRMLD